MKRSADITPLTSRLAALSELIRLRLCRILEQQELGVGEVAKVVQLPQSTVSRHLKVLTDSGWLSRRSEGTATMYSLRLDDLDPRARELWRTVRDQLDDRYQFEEDLRRIEAVISERRTDPLSFFGRVAGEWDELRNDLFGRGFSDKALLALIPREWVIADVGCGTGNAAESLAPYVEKVIAIDQSEPMLEAARKRLSRFQNISFVQGSLESLPLGNASVDAVTCVLVLHYIPDPVDGLREMARITRPGGRVLVIDMFEHDRTMYKNTMGHEHLGFSGDRMTELMESAGLTSVSITPLDGDPDAKGPGLFVAVGKAQA